MTDARYAAAWAKPREPYLLKTCIPGIFAAADSRSGAMARVASAVGGISIKLVHQYPGE